MDKGHQGLSAWQLTMLALGTVVGGSFFLGSAVSIRVAGPAVMVSYLLGGVLVYFILYALSEMTVSDPAPGSFRTYAERMFGRGMGFVVGWMYWTGLILAMSSEATAAAILLQSWFPGAPTILTGTLIIIGVTGINLLGADRLSKLESGLAAVKLFAIVGFIILALSLIGGWVTGIRPVGLGALAGEAWLPGGIRGIAGSMLIVMFTYAGFEMIGLAASEARDPERTVPRAIIYTIVSLVGLYMAATAVLLPLVPTNILSEAESPLVTALSRWGIGWAGIVVNAVLLTAILSTMLAAMFGLGRMIRSLAQEGHAPSWLQDKREIPLKGILFSGAAMLAGLGLGYILPRQVYLFLISSGGFSLLLAYAVIVLTHYRFRQKIGCSGAKCQFPGYPYTSWVAFFSIIAIIASMPLVPGQGMGLLAGLALLLFYILVYMFVKRRAHAAVAKKNVEYAPALSRLPLRPELNMELGEEWHTDKSGESGET